MNLLHQISIALPFLSFIITLTNSTNNPTHSNSGDVSINCGSSGTFAARNGREWVGDVTKSKHTSLLQIQGSSTTSTTLKKKLISADPVPHKTARVSRSQFSYAFQVSPGQKILRLHFTPSPYKDLKDLFTVEAGPFTLLGNFSASLTADTLRVTSFIKEFCLNIQENEQLNVTFFPESYQSLDTYAFINGIEIISVPNGFNFYHFNFYQGGDIGVQVVDHHTALELVHRLNIKRFSFQSSGDFEDTYPLWDFGKADKVKTHTWKIAVDVGFRYLIRLHFSEIGLKIAGSNDLVFKVLINEIPVQTNIDLVRDKDNGNKIASYKDYLVMMRGRRNEAKCDVLIYLESYDDLIVLAGFEIFKLSNNDNSLAGLNPLPSSQGSQSKIIIILFSVFRHRNAYALAAIAMITMVVHKLREHLEDNSTVEEIKPSARAERLCRRFSLIEIKLATGNFSDGFLIGRGGFGKVYKGLIDREQTTVAVKRLKSNSTQGANEFLMEIETLSELRHVNLISLIGYCNEHKEMILVYDYLAAGTLSDHLYKLSLGLNNVSSLTWKQRLNICIGAGRGLDYLHTGHRVIHRDVKTSNILLDENFVAKVSDFGLAKHEDRNMLIQSHISTRVKGTRGYLDPHYLHTRKLTRKTDTYAFGVVLFEILCGRPAVDLSVAEDKHVLMIWARNKINEGEVDHIVALSLRENMSPASLKTFVGIAQRCLCEDPKYRPTMSQVVQQLELALEQHENKQVLAVTNSQAVKDVHQSARRATVHKPLQFRPWDAIWNRVKTSKKNDTLSGNVGFTKYDWDMIAAATNQFSTNHIFEQGVFGSVYKGVLPNGLLVTVKRLSPSSIQGHHEFKKEIHLLPNLQHPNIIKLLGYCIHREVKLLIYEFTGNKSLDTLIDKLTIPWGVRFEIIKGIARGVVYLHQISGPRIIHRNIEPGNILLDKKMNPKILDFAIARTLVEDCSQLDTGIPGTIGYLSPECYLHGKYSVKSDVYSFGIIILEILSGLRESSWSNPNSLCDHAYAIWNGGKTYDLMDKSLEGAFPKDEALRCNQVALACIQFKPNKRPDMLSVLKMLEGRDVPVVPVVPVVPQHLSSSYSDSENSDST